MRRSRTEKLVGVSMLAAIGYVLMFFAFPVVPLFPFMKVDFSEIAILVGAYVYGPMAGIAVALVRSILHFITTGGNLGSLIGNVASFIAALAYILPIYFISQKNQSKKRLIPSLLTGTLTMTAVMALANYFVITPLYLYVLNFNIGMPIGKYVVAGVIPFNLIKGLLVSIAFVLVHGALFPWLRKKNKLYQSNGLNSAE